MLKNAQKDFIQRHIGPSKEEQKVMLKELGYNNLDELIAIQILLEWDIMEIIPHM